MKKILIGVLILALIGSGAACLWQQQEAQSSAAALIQARADLVSEQQKTADLIAQIDDLKKQLDDLAAQIDEARQQTITAEAARQQAEADKAAAEQAAKQAAAQSPQANPNNSTQKDKESIGLDGKTFLELIGGGNGDYLVVEEPMNW